MTEPMTFAPPEGDAPAPPTVPVAPVVRPRPRGGGLTNTVLTLAALVAVGGVAFAAGRATAPASPAAGAVRTGTGFPAGGPTGSFDPATARGGFGGDRTVTLTGTVRSADGSTLVITAADGTETTIDVSGTAYHAQAPATAADVTAGDTVQVSVTGFGGFRPGAIPGASAAPTASGAPVAGTGTITATDVTITSGQ
ncbi:MAG TPA: hypothetical protein VGK16_11330 [Candidatus Limnocylindrales bacterium]